MCVQTLTINSKTGSDFFQTTEILLHLHSNTNVYVNMYLKNLYVYSQSQFLEIFKDCDKKLNVDLVVVSLPIITAWSRQTDAKEEASLWPDLPNKAQVSQATALIGFKLTGAEEQKNQRKWNV